MATAEVRLLRFTSSGWQSAMTVEPGEAGGEGTARANGGRHGDETPDWYTCPYPGSSELWKTSVSGEGYNSTAMYLYPWWEGGYEVSDWYYGESNAIARRCLLAEDIWPQ